MSKIFELEYEYAPAHYKVICHSCGTTRDTRKEFHCKKCIRMFDCRTMPDRMLHSERIREAKFIVKHWTRAELPRKLKKRRLEELAGREMIEAEPWSNLVDDIAKQDKYPGMPKHYKKDNTRQKGNYIHKSYTIKIDKYRSKSANKNAVIAPPPSLPNDFGLHDCTLAIAWTPDKHDYTDITKDVFDSNNGVVFEGVSDYLASDSIFEEWDDCVPY